MYAARAGKEGATAKPHWSPMNSIGSSTTSDAISHAHFGITERLIIEPGNDLPRILVALHAIHHVFHTKRMSARCHLGQDDRDETRLPFFPCVCCNATAACNVFFSPPVVSSS